MELSKLIEPFETVLVEIGKIKPYEKNAKKHNDKQVENVANSIMRFGWQQPIVCDDDGVVIIGHCRLLAAKKLGLEMVPVKFAGEGLTPDEIRALRLADNKTNESEWDAALLDAELYELADIDMAKFGFDEASGFAGDDGYGTDFTLREGEKDSAYTMTFSFAEWQNKEVEEALAKMKRTETFRTFETSDNKNSNGNALYLVVKEWQEQKKFR